MHPRNRSEKSLRHTRIEIEMVDAHEILDQPLLIFDLAMRESIGSKKTNTTIDQLDQYDIISLQALLNDI